MRSYLVSMVSFRQTIPRGEVVMRLICLSLAVSGAGLAMLTPWRVVQAVGVAAGVTGVMALTVTVMRWDRYQRGSWRKALWTSRAERRAMAERAVRLRLPEDQNGQQG